MHYFPWFIKCGGLFVTGNVKNEKILKDTPNIISSIATNTTSHTKGKKKERNIRMKNRKLWIGTNWEPLVSGPRENIFGENNCFFHLFSTLLWDLPEECPRTPNFNQLSEIYVDTSRPWCNSCLLLTRWKLLQTSFSFWNYFPCELKPFAQSGSLGPSTKRCINNNNNKKRQQNGVK